MKARAAALPPLLCGLVLWSRAAAAAGVQVAPVTPVAPAAGLAAPIGWTGAVFGPGLASSLPGAFSPPAVPGASPLALPVLPSLRTPVLSPVLTAALSAQAAGAAAIRPAAQEDRPVRAALPLRERLAVQSQAVAEAGTRDRGGAQTQSALDDIFLGGSKGGTVVNDEGIRIYGRALAYYQQVRALVEKLEGRTDLKESLDVMDDSYGDAWAKLKGVEAIAAQRSVSRHNTHLDGTLLWVDGVLRDGDKKVAVNTNRVFFHRSPNPQSEIEEGNRRVDGYLREAVSYFAAGGKADQALGGVDEVVLAFDTRGYAQIKEHIRARAREIEAAAGKRFRFAFLDELIEMPKSEDALRKDLNGLIERYGGDEGLGKIIEGVVYGRYVGLLLELRTLEHYLGKGYEILQSGRELFDKDRKYLTELDAVVRDPRTGRVSLVEAKSARVPLPFEQVLRDKVVAKLENYSRNRALLDQAIGAPVDEVVFSFDVGSNKGLEKYLREREAELGKKYGFAVKFLFIESSPRKGKRGR